MTSNNFHNRRDLQQMLEDSAYQRDNNKPDIIKKEVGTLKTS